MKLAIPSYIYPDAELWPRIIKARPALVVINPHSGPDHSVDPNYARLCKQLERAAIRHLGYIATKWARPSTDEKPGKQPWEIDEERERYLKFYPSVSGFFYDEAPTQAARAFNFRGLVRWAPGGMANMVLNPGTMPESTYLSLPAIKMCYETDFDAYMAKEPPTWVYDDPRSTPEHWWHCVYGVMTKADAAAVIKSARRRKAGYVWITSGVLKNPYNVLPEYFEELQTMLVTNL